MHVLTSPVENHTYLGTTTIMPCLVMQIPDRAFRKFLSSRQLTTHTLLGAICPERNNDAQGRSDLTNSHIQPNQEALTSTEFRQSTH